MDRVLLAIDRISVNVRGLELLREVSLRVNAGEIVAVIGPNGAGKSTLLRTIIGLHKGSSGSITFNGIPIEGLPPEQRVQLGITAILEGSRVFEEMTVLDNLKIGSYLKAARVEREKTMGSVFEFFPLLKERVDQKAGTLSGGERQMLAIGRALMSKPGLLLMDEPSLGLAPLTALHLFETVKKIAGTGLTVLLVEQNVSYSLEIAHRAYVLENGSVAMEGPALELLDSDHVKRLYLAL